MATAKRAIAATIRAISPAGVAKNVRSAPPAVNIVPIELINVPMTTRSGPTAAAIADSKIAALETSKTEIESDIADNANNISAINERIATANANISTLDTQVTTLYNQPRVAVITCSLPNDIPVNENNTYSNTKNIMLTDIVEKLPVSHPEKVNVAVTSVRYTSVPTGNGEAYGEQITPDILYYGGTSADNTNDRSFSITFNDYKQKPQSLIVTLVYWEEIDGNIIIHS
jgi:hypothetical protein